MFNTVRRTRPVAPLAHTELSVCITDLVAEHTLRHHFENAGKQPLEVVYSFPLPLDAAFLGLTATLAGRTFEATVQARASAERDYDDAIADGHGAVLLTQPEPGLLCLSLGNLLPGEHGEIELRFATALRVADREARYSLPLVQRPRYGQWRLEALETPSTDFAVEHPLTAHIEVHGLLAHASTKCSSHGARFAQHADRLVLDIDAAMLDRDLVLGFALAAELSPCIRLVRDDERNLALASLVLPPRNAPPAALDLCLLLDGSGSMAGDAIAQSRRALTSVADAMGTDDRLQVIRFGSTLAPLFRRPLKMTPVVRDATRQLADCVDADLGGTDMGSALLAAVAQLGAAGEQRSHAIILVTDGAVQAADLEPAQREAAAQGIRVFVVAVGSAAGTEVLEPVAERTGAMLERAVPGEPINACVLRQLRRAREIQPLDLRVAWPAGAQALPHAATYPGDAVSLAAVLPAGIGGEVGIHADALDFSLRLHLPEPVAAPALRAILGQRRWFAARPVEQAALALHYGLLTRTTAAVLVCERADGKRADTLPVIAQVPSMLPEGMVSAQFSAKRLAPAACVRSDVQEYAANLDMDCYDSSVPMFLRRSGDHIAEYAAPEKARPAVKAPALPRTAAHALHDALAAQLAHTPLDLDAAVASLPDAMQASVRGWLARLRDATSGDIGAAALLLALQQVLALPAFGDDEEAALALCLRGDAGEAVDHLAAQLRRTLD